MTGRVRCSALLCLVWIAMSACWSARESPPGVQPPLAACDEPINVRPGVALSLDWMDADPEAYTALIWEIARLGAQRLLLAIPLDQASWNGVPGPMGADRLALAQELTSAAHAWGLDVVWMPWIRLDQVEAGRWRGTLAPEDARAWWRAYGEALRALGRAANDAGAATLVAGSELGSLESMHPQWSSLVAELRASGPAHVAYAANWDRAVASTIWRVFDDVAVSFYPPLTTDEAAPAFGEIRAALRAELRELSTWAASGERAWQLMEVGYPSARHAALRPWDHVTRSVVDVALQDKLWHAFLEEVVCLPHPPTGYFVWNWFGPGGLRDGGYTVRGKPAYVRLKDAWRNHGAGAHQR